MNARLYIGPDQEPDRYRLLKSIGRGGEATLYLAELELAGATEPVVVKILDSRATLTPADFQRISTKWRDQAELLRFVHRPGVVGVREHFEGPPTHPRGTSQAVSGRALYLVMNHVEGLDLRDWRAERTLAGSAERREAIRCIEQLAEVLDWLHSGSATPSGRVVVHGDLSPGNVMIDTNGQATLVDFGLSKLTADHLTAEVRFTPGFAAPEVFEGKRSPATDRYAFGALAYFLLSGESPATTPQQLREAFAGLPCLATLAADTDGTDRLLSLFSADPASRPEALTPWVRALRHAAVSTTTASTRLPPRPMLPPTAASAPKRHTRSSLRAVIGSVALVLLVTAGVLITSYAHDLDKTSAGAATAATPPSAIHSTTTPPADPPSASPTPAQNNSTEQNSGTDLSALTPVSADANADGPFTTGPAHIGTHTYPNSVTFTCGAGFQSHVVYDVAGYSTLSATVGSPNDADYAVGNSLAVNFFKDSAADQLGPTINVSVGKPQKIHVDLNGASQLEIACSGLAAQGYTEVALGDPELTR
ncbi:serine/threonine-protein kinase [Streptomyces sp. CoH27]|uniref:serine/threonine protein kinase n=1 Tax=Streptomyces sp. CoH27 TaxID=2875763 RepID=UPI001CD6E593|nr:serine/threonine-protein kinase [Streptomyces sp. CoH27]